MPSFTERHTIPEEYVDSARREMKDEADALATSSAQVLRHYLIFGDNGDNQKLDFFRELHMYGLRGENTLGVIKKGEGKSDWYLRTVAEDLADPKIRYEYLENKDPAEQIRFIQKRYQWDLSVNDVQEILGRIALFHARENLEQISTLVADAENPLGDLKKLLFGHLGEIPSEQQILALRQVGL
jgi:hypothetical protein